MSKRKSPILSQQFSHKKSKILVQHYGMDADEVYEPSVWWYEKLMFLRSFVKTRKIISSLAESDTMETDMLETDTIVGDDSCSNSSGNQQTPRTVAKKRKILEVEQDPILNETVSTLKMLESKLTPKLDWDVYSEYISNELKDIDDEELINEAKHPLNNILYETRKKSGNLKKRKQNIGSSHVIAIPFNTDDIGKFFTK